MNTATTISQLNTTTIKGSESVVLHLHNDLPTGTAPTSPSSMTTFEDKTCLNLEGISEPIVRFEDGNDINRLEGLTLVEEESIHSSASSKSDEDVESLDNNPLLYWDVSPVPNTPAFYKEVRQINIEEMPVYTPYTATPGTALGNNSQADYFTAKVLTGDEEVPTKLQGLRDKWRGSIKNQLGSVFRSQKLKQEGQYLMALGHQKLQCVKSQESED